MYWNAAIHYNFYECEREVKPAWLIPNPAGGHEPLFYDYSVADFQAWWVRCAVDAVRGSAGLLDGLFLDATPKIAHDDSQLATWGTMVDQLRASLGRTAIIIDNGFYLTSAGIELAGESAWAHTGATYVESMQRIGPANKGSSGAAAIIASWERSLWMVQPSMPAAWALHYLCWLANASATHPTRMLIGHGSTGSSPTVTHEDAVMDPVFRFGLVKYLMVTSSVSRGYFIANNGSYCIDDGLLAQPTSVYTDAGIGCGEPAAPFEIAGGAGSYTLRRRFDNGTIYLDLVTGTSSIDCVGATTAKTRRLFL